MRDKTKPRGVLSTVLISFFLSAVAGYLWIGRGRAALLALLVMATLFAGMMLIDSAVYLLDWLSFTNLVGPGFGAVLDYLVVGILCVAVVLPFRRDARPLKWFSSGFAIVGLMLVLPLFPAVGVRTFLYQPFSIPSHSMAPALQAGDYLFASKYAYGYSRHSSPFGLLPIEGRMFGSEPVRGDVVVFKFPPNPSIDYVKRLVGLPGETVQMIDGVLHIDSRAVIIQRNVDTRTLHELNQDAEVQLETLPNGVSYEILNIEDDTFGDNTREYVVPPDHYFVLGDNRDNSTDSRFNVGFVPFDHLVGRAEWIYWNSEGREFADRADVRPGF